MRFHPSCVFDSIIAQQAPKGNPTLRSQQARYSINEAATHAGGYTVCDHSPRDGEHLCADAEDEAFCLCQLRTQCFLSKLVKLFRYAAN